MASNETAEVLAGAAANTTASIIGRLNPAGFVKYLVANPNMCIATLKMYSMAVCIIYIAAHASLRRPPSAAPAESKAGSKDKNKSKPPTQDLRLVDAVLFPMFATVGLGGMYCLLKYVKDPSILSKILRFNIVVLSIVSGGAMFGSAMALGVSIVFPRVWTSRDGRHIYRIDTATQQQSWADISDAASADEPAWTPDASRSSPFPDAVARVVPKQLVPAAWTLRRLLRKTWTLGFLEWLGAEGDEMRWSVFDVAGACFSLVVGTAYLFFSNVARPGVLSNLLGASAAYVALQNISGTSFLISTAILATMFVYDLVMVFYTPLMVTVATSVQAPVMLVTRAGSAGIRTAGLGLGDLTVPGILICLCLRYDLYRFYSGKIQSVTTMLKSETRKVVEGAPVHHVSAVEAARDVKAAYVDPGGRWGDWLWTGALRTRAAATDKLAPGVAASLFPKTFFHTAMVAYAVGLALSSVAVEITQKGQPALVYIVPVMLVATWGQAARTGTLQQMWDYTEDGSLDTEEVVVDVAVEAVQHVEGEQAIDDKAAVQGTSTGLSTRELRAQKRAKGNAA